MPDARSKSSDDVHAVVAATQLNVLSVAPLIVIPAPSAVIFVGVATFAISIFLSVTASVVELIVVVLPLTVRFQVIVRFEEIVPPVSGRYVDAAVEEDSASVIP